MPRDVEPPVCASERRRARAKLHENAKVRVERRPALWTVDKWRRWRRRRRDGRNSHRRRFGWRARARALGRLCALFAPRGGHFAPGYLHTRSRARLSMDAVRWRRWRRRRVLHMFALRAFATLFVGCCCRSFSRPSARRAAAAVAVAAR